MPFLLPAAATAVAAAAPAAAATTAAATAGATLTSIATNIAMNVAISAVMSALQPQVGAAGRTAEWTLSPDGPIPFAAGRIGVAGSVVHRATFGPDLMYLGVPAVLSGAGPIDGYESFKADDEWVNFDGNGKAISSQYAGELWYRRTMGYQPDVAVTSPPGLKSNATLPGWGAQHKLSGKAAYMVVMGENSKGTAFPTGEIKPLITLRGLKGWDPRLDSTWPGGDGPCRLDNPATWVYLRRPGLWGLKWALGLWEGPTLKGAPAHGSATDHQVGGIGAKLSGIDVAAFVNLENICDANDWTVSAYPTTDDDKFAVLESFLQAGGATFAMRAGKISCIQRAAPRTSIVTISAADTAGPLEIDTAASRIDRINTIRPRIMSEAHRWQMTAIAEVSAQAYRDQDGGVRPRGIDYTYVDKATQGAQLAALQIANTREGIAGVIPLKPHLQKIKPGDAFTITEPGFVLNGLKCLCLSTEFDPSTKIVAVSFVSETDAKYPFALGQSQEPPEPAELEPVDPRYVSPPGETEWEIVARPPAEGGAQVPGFDLVGEVDNATATALLVEWGPTAEGPWTQAYMGPPTAERIPITGVQPKAVYYVSTMNIRGQNYSARRVYGPFTAPDLVSNDTVNVGDRPAEDVAAEAAQVPGLALTLAGAQLTIADHQSKLYTATTGLLDRVAALTPAVFDPVTGLAVRTGQVETLLANGIDRIEVIEASIYTPGSGLSAIVAGHSSALITLEASKASAADFALIQAEVVGARNGSVSLSSQMATMRQATTDGLAGKASIASVELLEARARTNANRIVNPSGTSGMRGWVTGGSPQNWGAYEQQDWGWWFTAHTYSGGGGPGVADGYMRTATAVSVRENHDYTVSGWAYVGVSNPNTWLMYVEFYGPGGYITSVSRAFRPSGGLGGIPPWTFRTPAGCDRLQFYPYWQVPQANEQVGFSRLKLEEGTVATTFSDDAGAADLSARVIEVRDASASLEGRLEGRSLLQVSAGGVIVGQQFLAVSGPDGSFGVIDTYAPVMRFTTDTTGANPRQAMVIRDNKVQINEAMVDRLSVGSSITLGTYKALVAVQPFPIKVTDGVPANFGGITFSLPPDLVFLRDGAIQQPGTGESFDFYADNPTGTGFTPRTKIKTVGAPTNQSHGPGGHSVGGGIADQYFALAGSPVGNSVTVRVTGAVRSQYYNPNYNPGGPIMIDDGATYSDGELRLSVRAYNGSVSREIGSFYLGPQGFRGWSDPPGFYDDPYDQSGDFPVLAGDTHVGVSVDYETYAASNLATTKLTYQTASASGTRSATPNGELTTVMVYPKNTL